MTIPAYKFQDPANHVKFGRETDCRGCKHLDSDVEYKRCVKKPIVRSEYLKKCGNYKETE